MASFYCLDCGRLTEHVNVVQAAAVAQVTRATVYNWLHRAQIHSVVRPSGRKLICVPSLLPDDDPRQRAPRPLAEVFLGVPALESQVT